eukprot:GEMP01073821.1.p2 GENE.GEMP01073821.1~~GEMP01073821.1.p2  ORF type:complete len:148 (-),score=12.00 GEMP01073821.1:162-605(-)
MFPKYPNICTLFWGCQTNKNTQKATLYIDTLENRARDNKTKQVSACVCHLFLLAGSDCGVACTVLSSSRFFAGGFVLVRPVGQMKGGLARFCPIERKDEGKAGGLTFVVQHDYKPLVSSTAAAGGGGAIVQEDKQGGAPATIDRDGL